MFGQLLRNKTGNVRTYWNLFIVAFSVLAIIVLNRIILIVIGLFNDTTELSTANTSLCIRIQASLYFIDKVSWKRPIGLEQKKIKLTNEELQTIALAG